MALFINNMPIIFYNEQNLICLGMSAKATVWPFFF